ncbi:MAG: hypothetical protein M1826_002132 [Phylliscum demangeonii]|nr:MAG: hypothetical protein M1826_002132 [Phylliscum demangeonii]
MGKRGGKKVVKENQKYEAYYNQLGVVDEKDREAFWAALRRELPSSFRFTGSKGHALFVQQRLREHYIPEITKIDQYEGEKVEPPFPLPWFPDGLAWMMTTPKNVVRRYPPFASFQKFLVSETGVGNISRQEVVSMIPPLLLDVQPHMTVLDMCAAPGSKAAQLIEMVHAGEEGRVRAHQRRNHAELQEIGGANGEEDGVDPTAVEESALQLDQGRSTGLLIANDVDFKRSHMLVHQLKRLNSPNLIVTNHDATMFPSIRLSSEDGGRPKYIKFDRILADVPCSGDGTPRKNVNLWRDWAPGNAMGLHVVQIRILIRALQMLKVGGRVVYSTCSMNPIENEAVVAAAIDRCGGSSKVKLLDCSQELPGLKRIPGLTSWNVMDKSGQIWKSWKEVETHKGIRGAAGLDRLTKAMFPPEAAEGESDPESVPPLHRCMRVYAHLQDTGGFFIAVLEKQAELKARPESEAKKPDQKLEHKPSIIDVVEEMVARSEHATQSDRVPLEAEKLESLDALMLQPISESLPAGSPLLVESTGAAKRDHFDQMEAEEAVLASKKLRIDEDPDDMLRPGEPDPPEHWPPPPFCHTERSAEGDVAMPSRPGEVVDPEVDLSLASAAPQTIKLVKTFASPSLPRKAGQAFEEPFKYLSTDHPALDAVYQFYEISLDFPRDRFMVRNGMGEPVKAIYYTSDLVKEILRENEGRGIRFAHSGVKMFVKQEVQRHDTCKWRIQTEGLPILEPWIGEKRVVRLHKQATLRKVLVEMFPKVSGDGWPQLGEIGERVRDIGMGCCVLTVEPDHTSDGFR